MEKDYKADFISFLKKKRVWMLYKRQTQIENGVTDISLWLDGRQPCDYLWQSFVWSSAEKGHKFWHRLNEEWYEINGFSDED